jgi:hypothetical protein
LQLVLYQSFGCSSDKTIAWLGFYLSTNNRHLPEALPSQTKAAAFNLKAAAWACKKVRNG